MTAYELRDKYYEHHPDGHFFDEETLAFFGETVDEMEVLDETEIIEDYSGKKHECYVLVTYQHNAPSFCPAFTYFWFDAETFDYICD